MSERKDSTVPTVEGRRKAAALLLAIGKPLSDRLLKHFSTDEMRHIVETTAQLGAVPRYKVEEYADEVAAAVERGVDVVGSAEEVELLLSGVVPPGQIESLMSSLRPGARVPVWQRLADMPEAAILKFLDEEHPQVIAYILARTGSTLSAAILRQMPGPLRAEVVRRLLSIKPITERAGVIMEEAIEADFLAKTGMETGKATHSRVADIMNRMERPEMEALLSDLQQCRPEDAKLVKGLLFTFEDVTRLAPIDRAKLFDGVPVETTILSLHGVAGELREAVLASISPRSRRMIEQEIASASHVPPKEVAKARRAIADLALQLAERGEINVSEEEK